MIPLASASAVQFAPVLQQLLSSSSFIVRRCSSALASNLAQWQAKAAKELKGKDPAETHAHHTQDVSADQARYSISIIHLYY